MIWKGYRLKYKKLNYKTFRRKQNTWMMEMLYKYSYGYMVIYNCQIGEVYGK